MTVAHAYTLLLEATVLAASFGILWLSFWARDRRRQAQQVRQPRPLTLGMDSPDYQEALSGPVFRRAKPKKTMRLTPNIPMEAGSGTTAAMLLLSRTLSKSA